jgi:hypothetical protein
MALNPLFKFMSTAQQEMLRRPMLHRCRGRVWRQSHPHHRSSFLSDTWESLEHWAMRMKKRESDVTDH